jgi:hypothetical protein
MNEKQKNERGLQAALRQLPQYGPRPGIWEGIAAELERDQREQPLRQALAGLPRYAPPDDLWPRIAAELPRRSGPRILPWAAAAAAALALLLVFFFLRPSEQDDLNYAYVFQTEEAPPSGFFTQDWEEDQADLQAVAARFAEAPVAQVNPDYLLWREEWAELNQAKAEVVAMMQRYGRDGSLIRQLAAIERERSALARKMAAQI